MRVKFCLREAHHILKAFLPVTARGHTLYLSMAEDEKTLPLQACINELPSRPACQGRGSH